jgi:hypothetical protein
MPFLRSVAVRGTFRGDQEEFQVNSITARLHVRIDDWKRKKLQKKELTEEGGIFRELSVFISTKSFNK